MAPFPESESMTIKRLEVALRKSDMNLLKDGAYKLHEKFHTGHRFEYTEELTQILEYVNSHAIPQEIKEILCPTIEDILTNSNIEVMMTLPESEVEVAPEVIEIKNEDIKLQGEAYEKYMLEQNKVNFGQNQTNLQENSVAQNDYVEQPQSLFRPQMHTDAQNNYTQPTQTQIQQNVSQMQPQQPQVEQLSSIQPLQNFVAQNQTPQQFTPQGQNYSSQVQNNVSQNQFRPEPKNYYTSQDMVMPQSQSVQNYQQTSTITPNRVQEAPTSILNRQQRTEPQEVALFYDDCVADIDYTQIKDYRNNLNNLFSKKKESGDFSILKEIASILNLVDVNVQNLDKILATLATSKDKISLVTTSYSQEITKILTDKKIDFEIPYTKEPNEKNGAFDVIPMLGFSNIFVCSNCNARTLKTDFSTRTLSVQCPHCDSAAFPDTYAVNSYNPDCNPIFWHRAFSALARAKVWILINPPLDENKEIIFDFIKTAAGCANPRRIFILSRENDKKEFYKQMLLKALPQSMIYSSYTSQEQLCEEYIKLEIAKKN